jgi:hypothetical protein
VFVAQFCVPAVALSLEAPTRFGFQMYSGMGSSGEVRIVTDDGTHLQQDVSELVAHARPEIDWTQRLPEHLCARHSNYRLVSVIQDDKRRRLSC